MFDIRSFYGILTGDLPPHLEACSYFVFFVQKSSRFFLLNPSGRSVARRVKVRSSINFKKRLTVNTELRKVQFCWVDVGLLNIFVRYIVEAIVEKYIYINIYIFLPSPFTPPGL